MTRSGQNCALWHIGSLKSKLQWRWWSIITNPLWNGSLDSHAIPISYINVPDSNVHGVNMWPIWGRQDPGGPHVGPIIFATRGIQRNPRLAPRSFGIFRRCGISLCLRRWLSWTHCSITTQKNKNLVVISCDKDAPPIRCQLGMSPWQHLQGLLSRCLTF